MTRAFFLYLSQRPAVRRWLETWPAARKLTRRFVAGETLADAVAVCADLAANGIFTTVDHLGENVTSLEEAAAARQAYEQALSEIARLKLPTTISLKLTALGFDLSEETAVNHLRALAEQAATIGSRVEIDMEDTRYTERTVAIAEQIGRETGCIRVAIQAYLHRTPADIARLNRARVMVRLCKGAYIEPPALALPSKRDVDAAYQRLYRNLLDQGAYPGLATHDERMIAGILDYVRQRGIATDRFEFQMLHGIRRDLQRSLAERGYRMRVYVPYGAAWYRYFMRRLAERPANVWFIVRNLLRP
jgi:proline dehydrogenase